MSDAAGRRDRPADARSDAPANTTLAPWSDRTVAALNAFQLRGGFHPYTCREDRHSIGGDGRQPRPLLIATPDGWSCPDPGCDQAQRWAWTSTIEHGARRLNGGRPLFNWLTDEEADLT